MGLWTSEVVLPNSTHPAIRRFTSRKAWKSEKWAKRDVAFEAYLKLHSLKLVDDHLMPLVKMELQSLKEAEKRSPKAIVEERLDVWNELGKYWNTRNELYISVIQMTFSTGESVGVQILLPAMLPDIEKLLLFWSVDETVEVTFGRPTQIQRSPGLLKRAKNATFLLLENMHGRRMEKDNFDFAYLFLPQDDDTWDQLPISQISALKAVQADLDMSVLRDKNDLHGASYVYGRWRMGLSPEELSKRLGREIQNTLPVIEAQRLTRRRDFLHPEAGLRKSEKRVILLPEAHIVKSLPWRYSRLALLLPFAIDRCEKALLAENMKHRLGLESLPINMTVQALTASSARDPVDYQRLEFLGDSVLKFLASIGLVDEHPLWHEGYLSGAKDRIVSNAASSKYAIARKLSKWIITKSFTGLKWKPQYITTSPRKKPESKSLSTKILADVVEALIGVSYLHSGYDGATACCQVFSLGLTWLPLEQRITNLVSTASTNASKFLGVYPPYFRDLERILSYTFIRPSLLLEAITHLSYGADSLSTSYQRLEFLGDALLDMVVVNRLYSLPGKNLTHIQMHHLKSCCVNAGLLAYLCIGASVEVEATVLTNATGVEHKKRKIALHKFLRHSHSDIPRADAACLKRYHQLHDSIQRQLEEADEYPWVSLAELAPPKHISDIVESLIAAIWVDSSGSFPAVEAFVEKLGIFDVLERLVRDKVEPDHPMSRFGMYVANGGKLGVVKYHVEQEEGGRGYRCEVEVSGEVIVTVDGGVSAAHVKTWAANVGLKVMKERDRRNEEDRMVVDEVREMEKIDEEESIDESDSMLKSALGPPGGEADMFYDAAEELEGAVDKF
jgi:dsRNA-specific ribonuclease